MLLRFFWRSGALFFIAPLGFALEIPTFIEGQRVLRQNWPSTIEIANGSASLLVILAAVATCAVALGWTKHEGMLPALPKRSLLYWLMPTFLTWAILTAVHLVWVAFVCVWSLPGTTGTPDLVSVLPVVVALLAGSLIGALAAYVAKSWVMVPFLGLALYVCLIQAAGGKYGNLVALGGIGTPLKGIRLRPEVVGSQVAWFAVLSLAAGALVISFRRSQWLFGLTSVLAVLVTVAAGTSVANLGVDRFELANSSWSCRGERPRICALPEDTDRRDSVLPRISAANARWQRISPEQTPETYWQRLDMHVPGHGAEISLPNTMSDMQVMQEVISASYACSDAWSYEQYLGMEQIATDLIGSGLDDPQASRAPARWNGELKRLSC